MTRYRLVVLAVAVLACVVAAVVLASGGHSGAHTASVSPACLPATLNHSAALAGTTVDVSPAPDTATANPGTQVSFLGTPVADIQHVSVVGSRTGYHHGELRGYTQGDGGSFVPDKPFDAGEQVAVHAVIGAGGAGKPIAFSFRVDTPYPIATTPGFPASPAAPADYQSFATLPGVQAPIMTVTVPDRDPGAGEILTTNGPGVGQNGPLIYTSQGRLVWFDKLSGEEAAENLNEQAYEGRPALTWWKGRVLELGFGQGEDLVMNSNYRTVARVAGGNGLARGPARLPDRAPRHRLHHRVQPDSLRPDAGEGSAGRSDRRHGDSGDRYEDGPRALGMAQPRPRGRLGVRSRSADRGLAVGLLPPQLDRPRARRRTC